MLVLGLPALPAGVLDLVEQLDVFLAGEEDGRVDAVLGEDEDEVAAIVDHPQFLVDDLELLQHHEELLDALLGAQLLRVLALLHRHLQRHHLPVEVLVDALVEELSQVISTWMSRLTILIMHSTALADSFR